jgi:hypothetical protein
MIQILAVVAVLLLGLALERRIYRDRWMQGLSASLQFEQKGIYEGESGVLAEVVENRGRLPLTMLKCKFQTARILFFGRESGNATTDKFYRNDVFQIGSGERVTRRLKFTALKRGYVEITDMDLVSSDLFLTVQFVGSTEVYADFYVYPSAIDTPEFQNAFIQMDFLRTATRRTMEEPFSFRGIREYQPFDEVRNINWKASARTEDLLVNLRDYTTSRPVHLYLNLEDTGILKREDGQEGCFRIASGILQRYLKLGVPVTLDGNVSVGEGGTLLHSLVRNETDLETAMQAMALCDLKKVVPFAECFPDMEASDELVCFVTVNLYPEWLEYVEGQMKKLEDSVLFFANESRKEPEVPAFARGRFFNIPVLDLRN